VITSLNPNPMTGSTTGQNLVINGTGFVSGSGLKVTVGSSTFTNIGFISSSQLVVYMSPGASAQTLAVEVTNPGGQTSNTMNLTVNPAGQ